MTRNGDYEEKTQSMGNVQQTTKTEENVFTKKKHAKASFLNN